MVFGFEFVGDEDVVVDVGVVFFKDFEVDEVVVYEDGVVDFDIVDEVLVVDVDGVDFFGLVVGGVGVNGKVKNFVGLEFDGGVEIVGVDFWVFDVYYDGDFVFDFFGDGVDVVDDGVDLVVFCVCYVEVGDVFVGENDFFEYFFVFGCWVEGENDFGVMVWDGVCVYRY